MPGKTTATLEFGEIDTSIGHEKRGLYSFAPRKEARIVTVELNDARTDTRIAGGSDGLDVQGFAYIQHRSALQGPDSFLLGRNIEDIYIPEVCDLICRMTGAKKAIVNNCAIRHKLLDPQKDPNYYYERDNPFDKELAKLPKDKIVGKWKSTMPHEICQLMNTVTGRTKESVIEPARAVHVDYTAEGLRSTVRECRKDIAVMGQRATEAEDAKARGENVTVPRYAAYSVWRPLTTVKRDPLAVCDYRTIEKETASKHRYRSLSEQNSNGEYIMEYWHIGIPKDPNQAQWYWMPEQTPEDVLILKFADSAAETDPSIARYCAHASPDVIGTQDEEARMSIESRVIAFWE